MALTKYQVHDETTQVSYTTSPFIGVHIISNQMGRLLMFHVIRFSSLRVSCL